MKEKCNRVRDGNLKSKAENGQIAFQAVLARTGHLMTRGKRQGSAGFKGLSTIGGSNQRFIFAPSMPGSSVWFHFP